MPEFPDVELYVHCLRQRLLGAKLLRLTIRDPFVLRTVQPGPAEFAGLSISGVSRLGKRIVLEFPGPRFVVVHLMIAGRFRWQPPSKKAGAGLAAWEFEAGTLLLTEAGTKRRAKIHLLEGAEELARHDPGGLEIFSASFEQFAKVMADHRHTLKRILTSPQLFSGVGNAYSDEILLHARLSPVRLSSQLSEEELRRLWESTRSVLQSWKEKLIAQWGEQFPTTVTAFHPDMGAHGKFGQPCPQCAMPIQRIQYADNETNYCAQCQTQGRLLADRSLSRLLKADWPKTLDALMDEGI